MCWFCFTDIFVFVVAEKPDIDIKVQKEDTARVEDMVKEYFSQAEDVSIVRFRSQWKQIFRGYFLKTFHQIKLKLTMII